MSARVAAPGVYEVNSLCLKASTQSESASPNLPSRPHSGDSGIGKEELNEPGSNSKAGGSLTSSPFVRQLCDFSSVVVVMAAN